MELRKGFESRLQSLQRLCSSSDGQYPSGLLFVPGPDGRNNKGSISVLKYLFEGAVNRDLTDGIISDKLESLEEIILLIQETSVSIVYTTEMKDLLKPWLSSCPMIIEYVPTRAEELELDSLQTRKCLDFKRMMLEAVPEGASIGIPIPLGYEGVLDVETWPILQAFAMEEVVCSTGFFTQRYNVVDINEFLDILYCTLDTPHVNYAVRTMHQSILPHMEQSTSIMDALTAEQRARVTMEDVLGPLDMLFDFGELQATSAADPTLRPMVLVDQDTLLLGSTSRSGLPATWLHSKVGGRSTHYIVEACEPSSGLRWCRTYMLQRGQRLPLIRDASALVQISDQDDEHAAGNSSADADESARATAQLAATSRVISRLEAIGAKLTFSLRWSVREAFSRYTDVLEAGQYVQQTMDAIMKGHNSIFNPDSGSEGPAFPPGLGLQDITLINDEYLQVHMDCMNGHGKVVTIDDIDDMGGTCWTYIRVSVHRVCLGGDNLGVVAIGDTFLFSGTVGNEKNNGSAGKLARNDFNMHVLAADAYCITHLVPYYRSFIGVGLEERSSKKFTSWLKSPEMVSTLGLGKLLDSPIGLVGQVTQIPTLTDHPLVPFTISAIRGFTGGLVVEKMYTKCLPLLFSIEAHAECMWTVDLQDCLEQAKAALQLGDAGDALRTESGIMVIFRLKSFEGDAISGRRAAKKEKDDAENEAIRKELADRKAKFDAGFGDTLEVYAQAHESEDNGIASVFKLGSASDASHAQFRNERRTADDTTRRSTKSALEFNPLQRSLPALSRAEPRHIAICIHSDSRGAQSLHDALRRWRDAMRMHDVPEYKGSSSKEPLPKEILLSFIAYLDNVKSLSATNTDISDEHIAPALVLSVVKNSRATLGLPPCSEFLPMRCLHALNETSRLMLFKPREGEDATGTTERSADENIESEDAEAGNPLKLVIVQGHPGSCPLLLGAQISERLGKLLLASEREVDADTEMTAELLCSSMTVDFTSLGQRGAKTPEEVVNASWSQCRKNGQVSLLETRALVVSLVTNPNNYVRLQDVVSLLVYVCARNYNTVGNDSRSVINRGCIASCVISTLCPDSVLPAEDISPVVSDDGAEVDSSRGLGEETWGGCGLNSSHVGQVCDIAIAIDGSANGRAFGAFRNWLSQYNSGAIAVRVGPSNLRLDADVLDLITSRLSSYAVSGSVLAKPLCGAKSLAAPLPYDHGAREWRVSSMMRFSNKPFASLRMLQVQHMTPPPNSNSSWSVNSLIASLKVIFPNAVVNNNVAGDTWKVPAITEVPQLRGLSGLRLAASLAQIKVMSRRQCEEERSIFLANLKELLQSMESSTAPFAGGSNKKASKAAQLPASFTKGPSLNGIKSVHGIITVPVGNPLGEDSSETAILGKSNTGFGLAVVEACSGSIIVRYLDNSVNRALLSSPMAPSIMNGSAANTIVVCGVLNTKDSHFAERLFGLCGRHQLQSQAHITRGDVAKYQIFKIQQDLEAQQVPLPSGCWWNGASYIDHLGSAKSIRPDIEPHVDKWILQKNKKVDEYNTMLSKLRGLL